MATVAPTGPQKTFIANIPLNQFKARKQQDLTGFLHQLRSNYQIKIETKSKAEWLFRPIAG